ncbi:hypothetical protein [Aliterella atlantica]|uniref:hypothetical protein n=1 Tax=Aliterella atlantica TaxID=1827278 RepID=UPI000696B463|nr:hypothetical protein [Aliterella atlantica]
MQLFQKHWNRSVAAFGSLMLSFALAQLTEGIAPTAHATTHNPSTVQAAANDAAIPRIFNEAPFSGGLHALNLPLASPIVPPLPEQLQPPSAIVAPVDGEIKMLLTNPTNAAISFEVLGHTESRILPARSSLTLKNLPAPVGVTFRRQDSGLLNIQPQVNTAPGLLQITFNEATDLSQDRIALEVQPDGAVFLN